MATTRKSTARKRTAKKAEAPATDEYGNGPTATDDGTDREHTDPHRAYDEYGNVRPADSRHLTDDQMQARDELAAEVQKREAAEAEAANQ